MRTLDRLAALEGHFVAHRRPDCACMSAIVTVGDVGLPVCATCGGAINADQAREAAFPAGTIPAPPDPLDGI
jgi:hypothetical protein